MKQAKHFKTLNFVCVRLSHTYGCDKYRQVKWKMLQPSPSAHDISILNIWMKASKSWMLYITKQDNLLIRMTPVI